MMSRFLLAMAFIPFLSACLAGESPNAAMTSNNLDRELFVESWEDATFPLWPSSLEGAVVIVTPGATEDLILAFGILPQRQEIHWVYELSRDDFGELASLNAAEWRERGVDGIFLGNDEGHGVIVGPPPTDPDDPVGQGDFVPFELQGWATDISTKVWNALLEL